MNIQNHLRFIERTVGINGDLIVFPELSITGYEPSFAKELATSFDDPIFDPFQVLSDAHNLTIGMPTIAEDGINISMIIFEAKKKRTSYSKQILHSDELPYFVSGNHQTYITINNKKIALGICYESLQREHFLNAIENNAEIYIASLAKSQSGMEKANSYFPKIAREFEIPVLISNCIGPTDDSVGAGQTAVWNGKGEVLNLMNSINQGILAYDTELDSSKIHTLPEDYTSNENQP